MIKRKYTLLAKYALGALMTVALSFQPCLVSPAYGAMGDYDKDQDYPIWDDPDYSYSYYWEEDVTRKLTSVTRSYDDGTKYTATYQYNTNGDMIGAQIKETDGTSITIKREYQENRLIRSSIAEANASDKSQSSHITEYGDGTTPNYEISRVQYADKTTASEEIWYFDSTYYPIKEVKVTKDGVRTQADYGYAEDGSSLLSYRMISSDGNEASAEWRRDEEGDSIYYKEYQYDAALKTTYQEEVWLEGNKDFGIAHSVELTTSEEGTHRVESWRRMADSKITKIITTALDGSQAIESYSYNQDGQETLYTKTRDGQPTERRETTITEYETTVTHTDGNGLRSVSRESYDPKTTFTTEEETVSYADGSSSYSKEVYDYNYGRYISTISRKRTAEGTETYEETSYLEDGSQTVRSKDSSGRVLTIKYDSNYDEISRTETLPDGTTKEVFREYGEDGYILRETARYSDGKEDVEAYEYDEDHNLVKITSTNRNGIASVFQYLHRENTLDSSAVFNNGYTATWHAEDRDDGSFHYRFTLSVGELAESSIEGTDTTLHVVTIYRDGRTETFSSDHTDDNFLANIEAQIMMANESVNSFIEEALTVLPNGDAVPTQTATVANASTVVVAGQKK